MAQKITVNVGAAGKEVETHRITTGIRGAKPLKLVAKDGVNYELVDEATGRGPEAVATRRSGKDLAVSFEGRPEEPDLIIENYYATEAGVENGDNSVLIGQYSDGQFYAYVPDSAQTADAVSLLADEMSATQVLGGESLSHNISPTATALIIGGTLLAALAAGGGGGGSAPPPPKPEAGSLHAPDNTNNNKPAITGKGATPGAEATVVIKDKDGKVVDTVKTIVKPDGTYTVTPTKPIPDGPYTADATVTKDGQNDTAKDNGSVDTQRPTISDITMSDTALKVGETSTVTITFSEKVKNFDKADLTVENGTISGLASSDGGKTWRGTFTPTVDIEDATNIISVIAGGYSDSAGNPGAAGSGPNYAIDTKAPKVETITMSDTDLKVGETATITITFSEAVKNFDGSDITAPHGTLGTPATTDGGKTWTVTFTPTPGTSASGNTVTIKDQSYNDLADNPGAGGGGSVPVNYNVDTQASDAAITISAINEDTGVPGDFKTSDTTLTVSGTLDKALLAGEKVQISHDNGTTWKDATVTGTNWTLDDPTVHAAGNFTYTARVVNNAGTEVNRATQDVVIDTGAPTQTATITTIVDDQLPQPGGAGGNVDVANDGVTNDTTPLVKGTLSATLADGSAPGTTAEHVEVWVSVNGSAATKLGDATVNGTDWHYQDDSGYAHGDKVVYTVKVVDAVGHEGTPSDPYAINLDTTSPALSGNPIVINTNGGNNPGNDYLGDRLLVKVADGNDVAAIKVFDSSGKELSFTDFERIGTTPSFFVNGINPQLVVGETVVVRVYDAVGNVSQQSIPVSFTPNAIYHGQVAPDPVVAFDSVGDGVNPTIKGHITISQGADKLHAVKLYDNGHYIGDAVLNKADNTWSYSDSNYTFASGVEHKLTAYAVVEGPQSADLLVRIDGSLGSTTLDLTKVTANQSVVSEYANGKQDTIMLSEVLAANNGKQVLLQGDANDKVDAADSLIRISADGESTTIGGVAYTVWHDGVNNTNVLIQSGIEVI